MKIITLNCNGLRSASSKGFYEWMHKQKADVICLQETRLTDDHVKDAAFHPEGYHAFYMCAQKKGYSGVALYTKEKPDKVIYGLDWKEMDDEARYIEARFGKLCVVSVYVPSGTSGDERQAVKYAFMDRFMEFLMKLRRSRREYVLCGDWNIAHRNIDIRNWRSNQKNSGFLPEERAWMDRLYGDAGFVDAFRVVNQEADQYTWWSNRGRARENNVGWRIDYQVITPGLTDKVVSASVYKEKWFSDHAPLVMEYGV
ncbi:MAG: exodeoxyribonuclease III [Spirochaetes bacterium]|nr:MAG: exodeoxyribonuclease III [Spirochaetota bacterium]